MKVAITGKGGVGKTTLSSTLARLYADEGRTVLAADVDPDANLGLALGLTQEEVDEIVPISKMRTLVEERTGANAANKFFKLNPQVSDIPDTFSKEINGVKLLVMGTVDVGGSGCVCPEHVMLKSILSALTYRKNDVVIMDMEAGLHASCARLNDHDKLVHIAGSTPTQMLQACFHIHDDHIVLPIGQRGENGLEHYMFGTDTTAAAHIHSAHHQQFDAVDLLGEGVGNIRNLGIQLEKLVGNIGAGAFLD